MASGSVSCSECGSNVFFTSVEQVNVPVLSPTVSPLLRTNDLPGASDNHLLKESVQYIDDTLGVVQADIHHLSDILSRLKEKQKLLKDAQDVHKIILSPIRRLHPEILVQIFLATYSDLGERDAYDVFDVTSGPWLVGQVCSKWRAVVVSHSMLWSTMRLRGSWSSSTARIFDPGEWRHVAKLKGPIPLLSSALSRSGQHNLSFSFHCFDYDGRNIAELMSTLFHLLLSHCSRWENVTLPITAPIIEALSSILGRFPMLTDLELTFLGDDGVPISHIDAFSIAPRLSRVQLKNLPQGVHVHLANSCLVRFSDHRRQSTPMNSYLLDIIQKCPNLEIFEAAHGQRVASPSSPMPSTRVLNTSLRELYVCEGDFLESLVLPALETVSVTPFSDDVSCPPNALSGLHTLLSQSHCPLTQLVIGDATPDRHLFAILELVPTLTSLSFKQRLIWPKQYDDFFQMLISRMEATSVDNSGKPYHLLLPNLEELSFTIWAEPPRDSDFDCFVNHDFVAMVLSRWDSYDEPSLSSVSVEFLGSLFWKLSGLLPGDVANLKRCQTEELKIAIRSKIFNDETECYV